MNYGVGQEINSNNKAYHVFLTGNTVDLTPNSSFYQDLRDLMVHKKEPFSFIINGDLISASMSAKDSLNLSMLVKTIEGINNGNMIIVPGDRDWADSKKNGWKQVLKLERLIESFEIANVKWVPPGGCPGPELIELNSYLNLIVINTQWWNHPYDKPQPIDGVCHIASEGLFLEELNNLIATSKDKNLLIAGHFPLFSIGHYGGQFPFKRHLFPVPVLGSMICAFHKNVGNSKDICNANYDIFRKRLFGVLADQRSLIYASGHERNIQILRHKENYAINSGVPGKPGWATFKRYVPYAEGAPGLVELIYHSSGRVDARIYNQNDNGFEIVHSTNLFQSYCEPDSLDTPSNISVVPCFQARLSESDNIENQYNRFGRAIGGVEYKAGALKRLFLGSHYRNSWTTEITVPYLNIDTTFGGLSPYKVGGGRQTKALKFQAGNGHRYTFRSVNKDPAKALRPRLRETFVLPLVKDQISTQHPYGAMAVDIMLNSTNILHASPKLYLLPDDPKLGPFQWQFGGMLGMLEESPKGSFAGSDIVVRTFQLFRDLYQDHNNRVDAGAFAEARIFDIFIGDWGRHEDNWKWAGYFNGNKTIYKPIPRDRDHSFSRWDGILPWLADRKWGLKTKENFGFKIKDIRSLTAQAVHLDRLLISELNKEAWLFAVKELQRQINDSVIESAVRNMPAETYELSGREIERKLKYRIHRIDKDILNYYLLHAKYVDIVGSNKQEFFEITRNSDGTVGVSMYDVKNKIEKGATLLYHRKFNPEETKEIRTFGLGGNDIFKINGIVSNSIKLRIIGGSGTDLIEDSSGVSGPGRKTLIYEKDNTSQICTGIEGKWVQRNNIIGYEFDRTAFSYNTYMPLPVLGYSLDKGFEAGIGVRLTRQHYGKPGYSCKHKFFISGTSMKNLKIEYQGKYHYTIGKWNSLVNGIIATPDIINYFYGVGNETLKDEGLFNNEYYKTRNNSYRMDLGLEREFWKHSNFTVSTRYENNNADIDDNTILIDQPNVFGADDVTIVGGVAAFDIDFRDNLSFPKTGMRLLAQHENGIIISKGNSNYGLTTFSLEYYATLIGPFQPTLGIKAGGGMSYGEIPFYKQHQLGQENNLHGYRRNRFTGDNIAYLNSELRLPLTKFKTKIAPIKFGLIGFNDVGRVFQDGEQSVKWHHGYGGGFYLIPLARRFALSFSIAFSEEEKGLLLFSFGTLLN